MAVSSEVIYIVLSLVNLVLHTTGCYLITCQGVLNVQHMLILNLSITEILKNIINVSDCTRYLLRHFFTIPMVVDDIFHYVTIIYDCAIYLLFYLFMVYITIDRLLRTLLNVKYPVYITFARTKYLIIGSWLVAIITCVSLSLVGKYTRFFIDDISMSYAYTVLDFSYLILAVLTYSSIFFKLMQSRIIQTPVRPHGTSTGCRSNISETFQKSRFYVCLLLISSFLVCNTIPGLVYIFVILFDGKLPRQVSITLYACYILSDTTDACIYIFLQRSLRTLLWKKLRCHSIAVHPTTTTGTLTRINRNLSVQ